MPAEYNSMAAAAKSAHVVHVLVTVKGLCVMAASSQGDMPKRKSAFSDAVTLQKGDALAIILTRDEADLSTRGVTTARIVDLEELIESAKNRPSDEHMEMLIGIAVQDKRDKRFDVQVLIEELRTMYDNVFGTSSDIYYQSGFVGLMREDEGDFVITIRRQLIPSLETHAAALAPQGYTSAMLTDLRAKITAFDAALEPIGTAEANAAEATRNRINELNEIWEEMTEMCNTAKAYYRRRNAGKYAEYSALLRRGNVPATPPAAPEGLDVDMLTLLLTWLAVAGATSYKVYIKVPATTGTWTQANASPITTTSFTLPTQTESFLVNVVARNAAGDGAASAEFTVNFGLASPAGFAYNTPGAKFVWVLVAGVTFYRMEASYDGGATWNEIFAGDFTVGEYGWSPPAGMFRLRAELNGEVSEWVYVTIA